ncbi:DUF2277 domain-containing protein [soil metagenome]
MCRNIRTLFNFDPPASDAEIRSASLQFVRKVSGMTNPSRGNEEAFEVAVERISQSGSELLSVLETSAPPKNRVLEAARARALSAKRFGT